MSVGNAKRKFDKILLYLHRFGMINGIKLMVILLLIKNYLIKRKVVTISLSELRFPIGLRPYTSDIDVFEQIFLYNHYDFPIDFEPKLIIDAGAYIGYSSLFFANRFRNAKIIAIEPEPSNFKLLMDNTINYKNIELVQAGVWNKPITLNLKDVKLGHWGFMVEEAKSSELYSVKAVTIKEILEKSGFNQIDILKLDIEGSEKEVFSCDYEDWLDKVKILIIELHDRKRPGCSQAFYHAVERYNFRKIQRDENVILIRH